MSFSLYEYFDYIRDSFYKYDKAMFHSFLILSSNADPDLPIEGWGIVPLPPLDKQCQHVAAT